MICARNIITANFSGGGTSTTTAPLWQWDYGQVLCITGIDLPAAFEVHFSTNRTGGVSTVAVGADGQVTIPNMLLTIGKNLNAWIYLSDSEGEGETEYSILIPVKARPMPETYDAEVSGEFDDVVRQVSEYAETAQTAADNAGASASAAAASADSAAASASAAESAKTAAETAQGKAEGAQAAAETAAQTATEKAQQTAQDAAQSAQSKADAESAAGRAEAAQTGAESAKMDAETAAQDAAASASAASASASSAGQAATSATQSATAAAGSATTAQGAAQTATAKTGEASASATAANTAKTAAQTAQTGAETAATNAGQSASTATAKAAEAAQSASGAAQSKTDAEAAATRAEQAAATLTVDSALSDTSVNPVQNKVVTGAITDVKTAINALKITDTASGAIASFADGADGVPMESVTVTCEPIQSGSGDPSPDNIRPITGRDNVMVTRAGKNLFDQDTAFASFGFTHEDDDSWSRENITSIVNVQLWENPGFVSQISMRFTAKYASNTATGIRFKFQYTDGTFMNLYLTPSLTYQDYTFTSTPNKVVSTIRFDYGSNNIKTWFKDVQFEASSTSTAYEPYNGQSVTVQLGQTVYGGTVDVTTGELVVDRAIVDFGSLVFNEFKTSGKYYTTSLISTIKKGTIAEGYDNAICNIYKSLNVSSLSQITDFGLCVDSGGNIMVYDSRYAGSTANEYKAAMSGVQLVYELATPQTVQLTPEQITTLIGANNVWSDGGDVSVDYVADTKLFIEQLTEPDADMVADANITSGQYFMVGNQLYLATANIASGAAIVPGVNCTRTNLASALNAINA